MSSSDEIQIKVVASREVIGELEEEARRHPEDVKIVSTKAENAQTFQGIGLTEVASIMTLVSGAYLVTDLAVQLYKALRRSNRITVQTPTRSIVLTSRENLTEEEVKKALTSILEIYK